MKARGLPPEVHLKPCILNMVEGSGIPGVEVKFVDIRRNTGAKATTWTNIDAEARRRGEQTGLDTLVVHAVNVDH